MGDDVKKKREELKGKLLAEFNKVAPKIMKVDDLAHNFEKDDGKYFSWTEFYKKPILDHMIEKMLKRDIPAESGVYTSVEGGKTTTYVSSEFLRRHMIQVIDSGRADGHFEDLEKAGKAAVDAVRETPDQTPRVRSGQITPKPKK